MNLTKVAEAVSNEGLEAFILGNVSPSFIDDTSEDSIEFKMLWEQVLSKVLRMYDILAQYDSSLEDL